MSSFPAYTGKHKCQQYHFSITVESYPAMNEQVSAPPGRKNAVLHVYTSGTFSLHFFVKHIPDSVALSYTMKPYTTFKGPILR